jgi:hypothetical protein
MLRRVLALLLLGGVSAGQSPFDGSWVNKMEERPPEGLISYSLTEETFRCSCAIGGIEKSRMGTTTKLPKGCTGTHSTSKQWTRTQSC